MSAAAFALLHPGVQEAVHRMRWTDLQPIQVKSIEALLLGTGHLLISAQTAGGKTEAAFLPVISHLAADRKRSIQALYIGPLVALINDQFERLDRLCAELDIPVHRWHGGASATEKKRVRDQPTGILLITPESLESNFINFGRHIQRMYAELDFVVIDELHSFLSGVRGIHLRSLLHRLSAATGRHPRVVGLSATLGDPEGARAFLSPSAPETVTLVQDLLGKRKIQFGIKAYVSNARGSETPVHRFTPEEVLRSNQTLSDDQIRQPRPLASLPMARLVENTESDEFDEIANDVLSAFSAGTNLIFGNSKQSIEALADRLHRRLAKERKPDSFLVHHGSLSKQLREEVEQELKSRRDTTALCSSTLEMGIDIGSIRRIGQIDPPWTVASLVQRLGRSGRREGEASVMRLYVRGESPNANSTLTDLLFPDLLRAIALTRLMLAKWLEPHDRGQLHLSTLVHQILSCLKQTGGMRVPSMFSLLVEKGAFANVSQEQFLEVLRSLGKRQVIEQVPTGEVILAPVGERITQDFTFYAAFASSEEFTVRHDESEIGKLLSTLVPPVGENLILAGRRWEVEEIETRLKVVYVRPARGGKAPIFRGAGGELHSRVVEEMRAVLVDDELPAYLDAAGQTLLCASRTLARRSGVIVRGILKSGRGVQWYPWLGSRGLRTLELHARLAGVACRTDAISITYPSLAFEEWRAHLSAFTRNEPSALQLARHMAVKHFDKFDDFLCDELLDEANASDRIDNRAAVQAARFALDNP